MEKLREEFAKYAHNQWNGWMKYLFEKGIDNPDGTHTMPKWAVDRWKKQMETPYDELSEQEKDNDRSEADGMIKVIVMNEVNEHNLDMATIGEHPSVTEELFLNVPELELQCQAVEYSVKEGYFKLNEALKNYKVTKEEYTNYLNNKVYICLSCGKKLTDENKFGDDMCKDCDRDWMYDYEHGGDGR